MKKKNQKQIYKLIKKIKLELLKIMINLQI